MSAYVIVLVSGANVYYYNSRKTRAPRNPEEAEGFSSIAEADAVRSKLKNPHWVCEARIMWRRWPDFITEAH